MLIKKESKLHGNGLFTTTYIKKGDYIGTFDIVPAIYETKFSMWLDGVMFRATNILKYSNYSSNPNAKVYELDMYASKNIPANTEILWRYESE